MKIKEFVERAKKASRISGIENIIAVKKYLPFAEKQALIDKVLERCKINNYGYTQFDETQKYIVFTINIIQAYTDLEFEEDYSDFIYEYDMLCENDLLSNVIDLFSTEYNTVLSMLNMKTDYILKSNSIECTVAQFLYGLNEKLNVVMEQVSGGMNKFTESISQEDIDKLSSLLKTLGS